MYRADGTAEIFTSEEAFKEQDDWELGDDPARVRHRNRARAA